MKCRKCGTEYDDGRKVCPECGTPVKGGSHSKAKHRIEKKRKAPLIIAVSCAAALTCAVLLLVFVILPVKHYEKGLEYFSASEWQEAAAELSKTNRRDAAGLCAYAEGMTAFENEQWEQAAECFLNSEEDGSEELKFYSFGRAAMQSGSWSEAALLFENSGYGDSADRAAYCRALDAWLDGNVEKALGYLDDVDLLNSTELYDSIRDASFFDTCFLGLFEQTLTESFELAGSADAPLNRSDALDISYYAFYDIFADIPEEDFAALFYDSELAPLAAEYIRATLTQWSVTDYDGYISAGHEEEYFSLAAVRRNTAEEISEKYGVFKDNEDFDLFVAQGDVLESYYEDVYLPACENILGQLSEKPFTDDGIRFVSIENDSDAAFAFSVCLRYHNADGTYAFDRADDLTVSSCDSVLICLQNYVPRVDCDVYLNIISLDGSGLTAYGII